MHPSSTAAMRRFVGRYYRPGDRVLDVGSMDVNGSYRSLFPPNCDYTGIDIRPGPAVDCVVEPCRPFPFRDRSFELVISGQCIEHDECFWVTVAEMGRVASRAICIIAPSTQTYHAYPQDYWRFMDDAPKVWARLAQAKLIDAWRDVPPPGDCVAFMEIDERK